MRIVSKHTMHIIVFAIYNSQMNMNFFFFFDVGTLVIQYHNYHLIYHTERANRVKMLIKIRIIVIL